MTNIMLIIGGLAFGILARALWDYIEARRERERRTIRRLFR